MFPSPQSRVPTSRRPLCAMRPINVAVPETRSNLTLAQQALLDFIARATPTQDEIKASCADSPYSSINRLTELKKMKLVINKQEIIKGRGQHFGENRYHLTELGRALAAPAGTR